MLQILKNYNNVTESQGNVKVNSPAFRFLKVSEGRKRYRKSQVGLITPAFRLLKVSERRKRDRKSRETNNTSSYVPKGVGGEEKV